MYRNKTATERGVDMWEPFWYICTFFSFIAWVLGIVVGWLPTVAAILAIFYWLFKHWENITGKRFRDTRFAKGFRKIFLPIKKLPEVIKKL